jgi:hypothetical protein
LKGEELQNGARGIFLEFRVVAQVLIQQRVFDGWAGQKGNGTFLQKENKPPETVGGSQFIHPLSESAIAGKPKTQELFLVGVSGNFQSAGEEIGHVVHCRVDFPVDSPLRTLFEPSNFSQQGRSGFAGKVLEIVFERAIQIN